MLLSCKTKTKHNKNKKQKNRIEIESKRTCAIVNTEIDVEIGQSDVFCVKDDFSRKHKVARHNEKNSQEKQTEQLQSKLTSQFDVRENISLNSRNIFFDRLISAIIVIVVVATGNRIRFL